MHGAVSAPTETARPSWSLGVDVGGTFTDAVLASAQGVFTGKVATTPRDQSEGVMAAVRMVLGRAGVEPADVEHVKNILQRIRENLNAESAVEASV